jgi:phage-related protein
MQFEVRKFEKEIDLIFEKVYSVNESISSIEREALIKGFEDGLNEGFGSWLGTALGKTTNFFKSIPDKAKDFYQKGKKYATQAWEWIKDLSIKIADGVKKGFETAVNFCTTNFKKFTDWLSNTYNNAIEGIKAAYEKFKGKIADFSEWCVDLWNRMIENVKSLVKSTKEKLLAMGERISEWVSNSWNTIKDYAERAKNSTVEAFRKLGEMVSNGLKSGFKKAGEIASMVLLVCAWPFSKLFELVKKIPSLFQKLVKIVSDYIKSEIEDFKRAYGEEMDRYRLSKNTPPEPPTDGPTVDLSLPEDEEIMSDEEAANSLSEIKRKLAAKRNENFIKHFENHNTINRRIKKFRNF